MKAENKTKGKKNSDIVEFLKAKKAKDGKLNKLGEWILSGQNAEWEGVIYDIRAVLK